MNANQEQARQKIQQLIAQYHTLTIGERKAITESSVVQQFVRPMLEALGWPVEDPARFKYELYTQAGRPDMTLLPLTGGTVFVEAKRFGVIEELQQSRTFLAGIVAPGQMSLPGMATDRSVVEQQAINYAFQNGGTWAILTNFERLRLFNARRDWLVLSFERPDTYLKEFDLLWQLSYEQICNGGLETLSNQRYREDVDTDYLNFINEWRERLAVDIITKNAAANPWAFASDGSIQVAELRAVVQRILDRLVIVRFAEDHLVIPPGTLYQFYELSRTNPYTLPLYQHYAHFYRFFDQKHNSALFAPDLADRAVLSNETMLGLTAKLYEARYRALSADIIGNTYEQYLGKTLVQVGKTVLTQDNLETRKKQGSYYTPQVIVRYLVDTSLGSHLYGTVNGQPDGEPVEGLRRKSANQIRSLRVIDPACGSGSFLIYAYYVLADFYRREIERLTHERSEQMHRLMKNGIVGFDLEIALSAWSAELDRLKNYPRLILEHHLYGVDLDPQAAEIATVNLMMRAMADQPTSEKRLPLILNQSIKVGNALIGAWRLENLEEINKHAPLLAELRQLRLQLIAEGNGSHHDETLQRIADLTAQLRLRLDSQFEQAFRDPSLHRPFHWFMEFPEVFLPVPRLTTGNPFFDAIVPRAARLTCTRVEFADLWSEVMQEAWDASKGASDPTKRQRLRDDLDALVANLYGLSRAEFEHILNTFPLVFPDDAHGRIKKAALLAVYDRVEREGMRR